MTTPNLFAGEKYFEISCYNETLDFIKSKLPVDFIPKLGIVLGSGLHGLANGFDSDPIVLDYQDIPHFAVSTVPGHVGKLMFGTISLVPTVMMVFIKHVYEGHAPIKTVYPIRIMKMLGIQSLLLTNAAGALCPSFNVGDFMIINDHVAFAGMAGAGNPLVGPNIDYFGTRFPPVSGAYDFNLRVLAVQAFDELDIPKDSLREGIYSFVAGPSFETRAEARFLRDYFGADAVGMSTVPEVIAALHCNLKVLALSLITNKVATGKSRSAIEFVNNNNVGEGDDTLLASHEEVLETSRQRSQVFQKFVKKIIEKMN